MNRHIRILSMLLLSGMGLMPAASAQIKESMKGKVTKCIGALALPPKFVFENESKEDYYDMTIHIRAQNGGPIGPGQPDPIDTVTIKGKDFPETHNVVTRDGQGNVTGQSIRIEAKKNAQGQFIEKEKLAKGKDFEITVKMNYVPSVPYCIEFQPTTKMAEAVVMALAPNHNAFTGCAHYGSLVSAVEVETGIYHRFAFSDVNMTGLPLNELYVRGAPGTFVFDAYRKTPLGDSMPSVYTLSNGRLQFFPPIMPNEEFFIGVITDLSFPGPLDIVLTLGPATPCPPVLPSLNVAFSQVNLPEESPTDTFFIPTCAMDFSAYIPPNQPEKYLNVFWRTGPLNISGTRWGLENIPLEYFPEAMASTAYFNLDPAGTATVPYPRVDSIWVRVLVTDSLITNPSPQYLLSFQHQTLALSDIRYGPNITDPLGQPPLTLPGIPPSVYDNGQGTRSVLIGCRMPNIQLDSSRYRSGNPKGNPYVPSDYAGDWNACGPAATANSFSWLRSQHPKVEEAMNNAFGQGDSAARKMMAEFSDLMDRFDEDEVSIRDFIEAKLAFIDKFKLPMKVCFQSVFLVQAGDSVINSPNPAYGHKAKNKSETPAAGKPHDQISPDWIHDRLKEGCDVELLLQWRKRRPDGSWEYTNGHYVAVTGIRQSGGKWKIRWKDDKDQAKTAAGDLRHGISDLTEDAEGVLRIPGLDNARLGQCFIEDVIVECYDESVGFNDVKGGAKTDPGGTGQQGAGSGGAGSGIKVELVDDESGLTVQTTHTDASGEYEFKGVPEGRYRLRITPPTGFGLSPKNIGNDTTDSDFDPVSGLTDTLRIENDQPLLPQDALLRLVSYVRFDMKAFLGGMYDPSLGLMRSDLYTNGQLPLEEPLSGLNFALDGDFDSISRPTSSVTPFSDWVVLELRNAVDTSEVLYSRPGLLLNTGTFRPAFFDIFYTVPGWENKLPGVDSGAYRIVLRHANHLPLMGKNVYTLDSANTTLVDFTLVATPIATYTPAQTAADGKRVMIPGDTDGNHVINASDRASTWNSRNQTGYLRGDVNGDGVISAADRATTWNNRNRQATLPQPPPSN